MAVAGSILDNAQTPEMRTYHAGQVARTAAIFNADEIVVFNDKKTEISEGDEVIAVVNGKEFSLMLTSGGNLYFTGNSLAIGHKQPCSPGQWNEVTSKPRKVARMHSEQKQPFCYHPIFYSKIFFAITRKYFSIFAI